MQACLWVVLLTRQNILMAGAELCHEVKRKTIIPRHLLLAVKHDPELDALFKDAMIVNGGVQESFQNKVFKRAVSMCVHVSVHAQSCSCSYLPSESSSVCVMRAQTPNLKRNKRKMTLFLQYVSPVMHSTICSIFYAHTHALAHKSIHLKVSVFRRVKRKPLSRTLSRQRRPLSRRRLQRNKVTSRRGRISGEYVIEDKLL